MQRRCRSHLKRIVITVLLVAGAIATAALARESTVLFREDFNTLDNWKPYYFPKIQKRSDYSVEKAGGESWLRAQSSASASAIVYKATFDVLEYPRARWRWKVGNIYSHANPRTKAGDDYPIRIYVMFEYDPDTASFGDRILYGLAKARFGEYPPQESLSYVWSSTEEKDRIITSPYTNRAKLVLLRSGGKDVGLWKEEEVNMLDDFRKAFGTDPPSRARIAIMNDSDNTGESSISWVDYIEVFR